MIGKETFRKKDIFWVIVVIGLILVLFTFLSQETNNTKITKTTEDKLKESFGWTADQFIEWAYEVQPIKEHKKWKQYRDNEPNEMEPNEPYACVIMNDANDVPWATKYWEECYFELPPPYEDLPEPVRKILDLFNQNDVGKIIGEVLPEVAKPVLVCYFRNGKLANSEPLSVRLLSLSDDKLRFRVAHEPFSISEVKGIKAEDRVILYTERTLGDKTKIGIRAKTRDLMKGGES